jgi:hypothetical protein
MVEFFLVAHLGVAGRAPVRDSKWSCPMNGRRPQTHGAPTPDEVTLSEKDQLVLELVELGVALRKSESLVRRFPHQEIRRQIDWLPFRSARRPASMIITAIENDYGKPAYANGE